MNPHFNTLILTDFYKVHHKDQYPSNTTMIYSNFTPRKSRIAGVNHVVVFGIQHFIKEYLQAHFDENFFLADKEDVLKEYVRHIPVKTDHIEALWELGYLPLEIKALPEGTLCPIGVPCLTIRNTHPDFFWLTNYVETLLSCMLWQPMTSATIAHEYKKLLTKYAKETDETNVGFVNWQGHDFSFRGMSSVESAILSGMGHLVSFTGTDTIPAIYQLERSYKAEGLIGASVPATEHSVMCMGTKEDEIGTFSRLLDVYPTGILSVVSDTWNLWDVVKPDGICTQLKEKILARDGKLVIRPDSGDPVDIVCGVKTFEDGTYNRNGVNTKATPEVKKGVVECLWDIFGGTVNKQGYKVLNSHIGVIYGDAITRERAKAICERLKAKGFASTNIVFGIGSYTYNYNTRDIFGFAMKATYGELSREYQHPLGTTNAGKKETFTDAREIFKNPITDDGEKKSAKGLLSIPNTLKDGEIWLKDQCSWAEEGKGQLQTVFKDGKLIKEVTLTQIRERLSRHE